MRGWWLPVLLLLAACSDDGPGTGPGDAPDTPASLTSTSLDGAIALVWTDNAYQSDPSNFQNYRVYSTLYDLDNDQCENDWLLEGTTVAPEFLAGALANGVPRCFHVTAVSVDGIESGRSPVRSDTPRPDSRNIALSAVQSQTAGSGFRFWDDLNDDGAVQSAELGLVRDGTSGAIDFFVDRDGSGDLFLTPVRAGTGVEYYDDNDPVEDLTSIDFAEDREYRTSGILAIPGYGYVFEMDGGDGFLRYGAVRVTHVGQTFLIMDWAFQTDPGNPELIVRSGVAMR
ncbi:MAG TPA: hypothetical protein VFT84_15385 [Gemmatimonadales bacterium]|nr:hypothetical protein [Gemmatimonadales bacterium]